MNQRLGAGAPLAPFLPTPASMHYRRLALVTALYLSLDLTNPFIGCAFNFNAEESMEGVSRQHERLLHQESGVEVPVRPGGEIGTFARIALVRRPWVRPLAEWFVDLRQAHAATSDPQSPTEDH
jgi:hypothetical protein